MIDPDDITSWLLLGTLGLALGVGLILLGWKLAMLRRQRLESKPVLPLQTFFPGPAPSLLRPAGWLAIRSASPESVRATLGLNRAEPCSWAEGLAGGHEFFISPRVHGWVIVTGVGLPNPTDDVDAVFLFLTALSRKLGHVQYFYANRRSQHHGWARLDDGCVTRAYAWTGETVWSQGIETLPEIEVNVKLFGYGDDSATPAEAAANCHKVAQLAARWSLDPAEVKLASVRQSIGLAGESAFI